jgi:FK506-binding protein 2
MQILVAASRRALLTSLAAAFVQQSLPPRLAYAASYARATDESDLVFQSGDALGLRLSQLNIYVDPTKRIDASSRVIVADVLPDGPAAKAGVQLDAIVVAVDGANVELENVPAVQAKIDTALSRGGVTLTLKDSNRFQYALLDPPPAGATSIFVSTALTPSSEGKPAQLFAVRRENVPSGGCRRPASQGDLIEISYEGRVAESGALFDGMDLAQRQGDSTIQFVLGKQPAGQFPPSWDVGLIGMCIGETRALDVPPVLGFGPKGLPKRAVPPNAALRYKVELVAINGLAID